MSMSLDLAPISYWVGASKKDNFAIFFIRRLLTVIGEKYNEICNEMLERSLPGDNVPHHVLGGCVANEMDHTGDMLLIQE